MTEKEIAEIRRRFRPDKGNITRIRGCYVNEKREIAAEINQSLMLLSELESTEILAVLKKTLSGTVGKNLLEIDFPVKQVLEGEEHKLLMRLRDSSLEDDEAVHAFFQLVIGAVAMEGGYLILLSSDKYDVPSYSKFGDQEEDSTEMFSYFLCSICPIKLTKAALSYRSYDNAFRNLAPDSIVGAPELGFMFPAFDDRCANIYGAMYYTRNTADIHGDFIEGVFHTDVPMPAAEQKELFDTIVTEAVSDDCSLEVVQTVHGQLTRLIAEHKESKAEEPLMISKHTVRDMLESCGVPEERTQAFEQRYDAGFGEDCDVSPRNIMDTKRFEVSTPEVSIKVNPERTDLVETRVINGVKYILIRADEGVEVNGISIHIS